MSENVIGENYAINLKGAKILIVDDTAENLHLLRKVLAKEGYELFVANSGEKAIKIATRAVPDLILLDVMMPVMDGFETCRRLKEDPTFKEIPVIFITAKNQTEDMVEAFQAGGVDFINKPFRHEEVLVRVRTHLQTYFLLKQQERLVMMAHQAQKIADQARLAAEAANRAKSIFLAKMSHELRTPLTAILGYTDLLEEEVEDFGYDNILPDLYKIQNAGKSLLAIVSDILDLTKIEADKMEINFTDFEVHKLISDVTAKMLPAITSRNNTLVVDSPKNLGTMYSDHYKLSQILSNLLDNANRFTPSPGAITMTVTRRTIQSVGASSEWLRFCISDTGTGIKSEMIEKIFQAFVQVDDSYTRDHDGAGLGLTICDRLSQTLGGRVYVGSEEGKGATFCLNLPVRVPENPVVGQPSKLGSETPGSGNLTPQTLNAIKLAVSLSPPY